MGVELKAGLEGTEWNIIWKEKQSYEKEEDILKSFHINVTLNMKHHGNLEGKCSETEMEVAERYSFQLPPLVIKNPHCQSFVMVHWKFVFCCRTGLDYTISELSYARTVKSGQTSS